MGMEASIHQVRSDPSCSWVFTDRVLFARSGNGEAWGQDHDGHRESALRAGFRVAAEICLQLGGKVIELTKQVAEAQYDLGQWQYEESYDV